MDCTIAEASPELLEICLVYLELSENNFLQDYGVIGLFFNALLAATALPIPTEILIGTLLNGGESEWLVLFALVSGGALGGIMDYGIGFSGNKFFRKLKPVKKKDLEETKKSNRVIQKFGWFAIFGSAFVPVLGDFLLISAGVRKMHFRKFVLLMALGKGVRGVIVVFGLGLFF